MLRRYVKHVIAWRNACMLLHFFIQNLKPQPLGSQPPRPTASPASCLVQTPPQSIPSPSPGHPWRSSALAAERVHGVNGGPNGGENGGFWPRGVKIQPKQPGNIGNNSHAETLLVSKSAHRNQMQKIRIDISNPARHRMQ